MIFAKMLFAALIAGVTAAHAETPQPFEVGGTYALSDQRGQTPPQPNPDSLPQHPFFGYASCPRICTATLPLLGEVTEKLSKQGTKVRRVMITADTARDAVENMARPLTYFHPNFIDLTEGETALSTRYIAFSVDHTLA